MAEVKDVFNEDGVEVWMEQYEADEEPVLVISDGEETVYIELSLFKKIMQKTKEIYSE